MEQQLEAQLKKLLAGAALKQLQVVHGESQELAGGQQREFRLAPGRWSVRGWPPYRHSDQSYHVMARAEVREGRVTEVRLRPVVGARVEIEVLHAGSNRPVRRSCVKLYPLDPETDGNWTLVSEADGIARLGSLPPGEHHVRAFENPGKAGRAERPRAPYAGWERTALARGGANRITLHVEFGR